MRMGQDVMDAAPAGVGRAERPVWVRVIVMALLAALVVPLLMTVFAPAARADDDEDQDNYSLYNLASNASAYFSNQNSPDSESCDHDDVRKCMGGDGSGWHNVTGDPASAGSLLGYTDPDFSFSLDWLASKMSGSSQTFGYDTFQAQDENGKDISLYKGLMDYAHFGAANNDLGLDSMSSGLGGGMTHMIAGSIMWFAYALAMGISLLFWAVIQGLKLLNPFKWFYVGVAAVNPTFAKGMMQGESLTPGTGGLSRFIGQWYETLVNMSWAVLVPLFIGFTLLSLVFFKKMDRGSAIKKLIVRVVFIGVGLPLIGSMYTQVLNQFDDSLMSEHAGPTRVVLSTYVDFNQWAMNDRLAIPEGASISWDANEGSAQSTSVLSVRTSALAINVQSHGETYKDIDVGDLSTEAKDAWSQNTVEPTGSDQDSNAVLATMGMLGRYIGSDSVAASDFESGVKGAISQTTLDSKTKRNWFTKDGKYGEAKKFGEGGKEGDENNRVPYEHPIIDNGSGGLTSTAEGGTVKTFTTEDGTRVHCGFSVVNAEGDPAGCNLSPLAMYNYLNTGFGPDALTLYSSEKATSGFTRESHDSVSQVGNGPTGFMYWFNAVVILFSIVVVGLWYGVGMLAGAVKRSFGVIAAIPFATVGALSAIAKVIIYSAALILEILVTLFLYQFISQFLVSLPSIIETPISSLFTKSDLLSDSILGSVAVVVATFFSTILIIGVAFALLRVRKSVLSAIDEAVTKMVDKFLDTTNPPVQGGGGMLPAMAGGAGAGLGMAASRGMMDKLGGGGAPKVGGSPKGSGRGPSGGPTNAGGTNGPGGKGKALSAGGGVGQLTTSRGEGPEGLPSAGGTGGGDGSDGPDGNGPDGLPAGGGDARALPAGSGSQDKGTSMGSSGDKKGKDGTSSTSGDDRSLARSVNEQGGLSKIDPNTGEPVSRGSAKGSKGGPDGAEKNLSGTNGLKGSSAGDAGAAGADGRSGKDGKDAKGPKGSASAGGPKDAEKNLGGTNAADSSSKGSGSTSGTKGAKGIQGGKAGASPAGTTGGAAGTSSAGRTRPTRQGAPAGGQGQQPTQGRRPTRPTRPAQGGQSGQGGQRRAPAQGQGQNQAGQQRQRPNRTPSAPQPRQGRQAPAPRSPQQQVPAQGGQQQASKRPQRRSGGPTPPQAGGTGGSKA